MKIKTIYIAISLIIFAQTNIYSQSANKNYIVKSVYTNDSGTGQMDIIEYFDGLGRLEQTIHKQVTPLNKDIAILKEYDEFGRESAEWLPAVSVNNGAYVTPSSIKTGAVILNGNDQKPYTRIEYEISPLNKVTTQFGAGSDWHNNGKAVRIASLTNSTGTDSLKCIKYKVSGKNANTTLVKDGFYNAGELQVTRITDEDNNRMYEFKDKLGQVLLTRQINSNLLYDTYYVYDGHGNLCYVLPPIAANTTELADNSYTLKQYCYLYKYDDRKRRIAKRIPGTEWIYYVYDGADNLVFSQDGEQRANGEWFFLITDAVGREVLTGTSKNNLIWNNNPLGNNVVRGKLNLNNSTNKYYDITGVSLTAPVKILTANYYDNYDFRTKEDFPRIQYDATQYNTRYGNDADKIKHKGLLTGSLVCLLDGAATPTYLYTTYYYDYRKRLIQNHSTNHLSGGLEKMYMSYNFSGQPLQTKHIHSATGKATQTEVYTYQYDHAGRLLTTKHKLNTGTETILAENTYDELGRLKTNKKNNQANLTTTYGYNVRSWTKSISSPLFTETLYYNDQYVGSQKRYNGNVGAMTWQVQSDKIRGYTFNYDNLSQLTAANYLENGTASNSYKTAYTYDKHGNMTKLTRYGKTTASAYGIIDNVTMVYTGNQLTKATDAVADIAFNASMDFKDYANVATEYTYNKNGAMTKDMNKGISSITYNSLNLPRIVDIKNKTTEGRNEYIYSASGQKLRAVQKWNPEYSTTPIIGSTINPAALTQTHTTDYVGNIIYENNVLKRILVEGGYNEGGNYYFYMQDHLGNNRVVANATAAVVQSTHYYPFGTSFADGTAASVQPYKYNGKELDTRNGLNMYDYSARWKSDWFFPTQDPLSEQYYSWSPYVYVMNNPMKFIDPTGMSSYTSNDPDEIELLLASLKANSKQNKSKDDENDPLGLKKTKHQMNNWQKQMDMWADFAYQINQIANLLSSVAPWGSTAMTLAKMNSDVEIEVDDVVFTTMEILPIGYFGKAAKGVKIVFSTKMDLRMLRYAKETFKGNAELSKEASNLLLQVLNGNLNPGKGSKHLGKGIYELRGSKARIYFQNTSDGINVLGYSNKNNQDKVVNYLLGRK